MAILAFIFTTVATLVSTILGSLLLHVLYLTLRKKASDVRNLTMIEADKKSIVRWYFCAIIQAFYKSPGVFHPVYKDDVMQPPDTKTLEKYPGTIGVFNPPCDEKVHITECHMFHDRLEKYKQCIGYSGSDGTLPPCFMTAYFNKCIMSIGTSEISRVRVLGIVHIKQEMTVYGDLSRLLREQFSFKIQSDAYRRTERGVECDVRCQIFDYDDILLWESTMTGLSLLAAKNGGARRRKSNQVMDNNYYREEEIEAKHNTGMLFARATQDWQPQHLNTWTAKLVGFDQPIAHGLWTMAVAVDRIMKNEKCYKNKYPLHAKVTFRRPFALGSLALLRYNAPSGEQNRTEFNMVKRGDRSSKILEGVLYTGAKD